MFVEVSEKAGRFPSDNYVSNESSYLHVDSAVHDASRRGGAYVGVGPEQNFTYIGRLAPSIAFIIDIRRENALLHLVYKVLFETSESRGELLAGLVSREVGGSPGADASLEEVLAFVEKSPRDPAAEKALVRRTLARRDSLGIPAAPGDEKAIRDAVGAFARDGLSARYKMEGSARAYPSLGELAQEKTDDGVRASFLAHEATFRAVKQLQLENRVVAVVGNLAGDKTVRAVGRAVARRGEQISVMYTSNVEQYVFAPADWASWRANVASLPLTPDAIIVRVYFDQGKKHPSERPGHRTVSLVHDARRFLERAESPGYKSWFALTTDDALVPR